MRSLLRLVSWARWVDRDGRPFQCYITVTAECWGRDLSRARKIVCNCVYRLVLAVQQILLGGFAR
jgi:hypothetical protein